MRKIGLTGGIGSGKSTVAKILVAAGVILVDADVLARAVTQPGGAALPAIREAFGAAAIAPNGGLDRDTMRQIMLSDADAKARLEGILHPLIGWQIDEQLQLAELSGQQIAVIDIPLLVEGGYRWRKRLDAVWVVDCLPQTQISRVQTRSAWPLAQIQAVIATQVNRSQRAAAADALIYNEGLSLPELERQILVLLKTVKAASRLL